MYTLAAREILQLRRISWDATKIWLWAIAAGAVGVVFSIADGIAMSLGYLKLGSLWMLDKFGIQITHIIISGTVMILGILAYAFKTRNQLMYGIVEVGFAAVAATLTARQIKPGFDWSGPITGLVGSVYIVSRGINNLSDGMRRTKEKR
jgi:hypothetical protein